LIPDGALPALAKKNEWMIRRGPGALIQKPWIQDFIVWFYRKGLMRFLDSRLDPIEKESVLAAAKELQLPYEVCREILFQPDAMMLLARILLMRYVLSDWVPGGLPGCTSGVALKEWTKSGRMLAGRNFDYLVVGPWEKYPTVVFSEPSEQGEIPHVFLTSAGVHSAGVTAINREGVTLFTHAHFSRKVSLRGRPIAMVGDEVIRKAKTIGQAVDIVKKNLPCANWAFIISSARENQAAVIEMSPHGINVRHAENGSIAHSNFFHSKELQQYEALLCGSYCEDLKGRICRMNEMLQEFRGKLEPHHFSSVLGDHLDHFSGQERVIGNTVGVVTTIKSAVFEPEMQRFWMANRHESPVGLGDYVEVNMDRFWNMDPSEYEATMTTLPGYQPRDPQLFEGIKHYRSAYQSFHMKSDEPDYQEKALAHLKNAVRAFPKDGHLWVQAGLMAFKLHQMEESKSLFEGSRAYSVSQHVGRVRDLYLARCYDLLGQREQALSLYRAHTDIQDPKLKKAFQKGIRKPYRKKEICQVLMDLQFADTFQY
jgi:predicted choloylglycine hydrolase